MSGPFLVQNSTGSIIVYLELSADGAPATGLTFSDITADLRKEGGSFTPMVLDGDNFTETGGGFYELDLATTDTDVLGNLTVRISGALVRTIVLFAFIAEIAPVAPTTTPEPPRTSIFGFLKGPSGAAVINATVSVRIISTPYINNEGDDGVLISDELLIAKTDTSGFFDISLITGSIVEVFISSANYRKTLTVPVASTNLFDIP